jgi:tripartite-type tricarboxylate transporter receptor subunit TctC
MRCVKATLLSAGLIACAVSASAQQFPTRPVRMIVPFVAGGGADVTARRLAEQLGAVWKQPVVIQNSGGTAVREFVLRPQVPEQTPTKPRR